jgi:hypothetical protein
VSLFERLRAGCAEVAAKAEHVRLDAEALERLAERLAAERPAPATLDPGSRPFADEATSVAWVLTLNAVNFGSGWFPVLRKRPGLSGYLSIATCLREHFAREGPWSAARLQRLGAGECARVFEQDPASPAAELMSLFARSLAGLGELLETRHGGRFAGPVEEAAGSAERLVGILGALPLWDDVARWRHLELPFYKRAQITCSDLALAFVGAGLGAFRDLDDLTLFADNLVPHVLRVHGVLAYAPALAARIDAERLVPPGSPEEVEIRAVALHAVEALAAVCRRRGWVASPRVLDHLLWSRGQAPEMKARPRHRTRCTFY